MRGARGIAAGWSVGVVAAVVASCVAVHYQSPGQPITPRRGKTLLFVRVRFFHHEREFFPWKPQLFPAANTERHVWLLRLGARAVSAELHPDPDGSLAIWLTSGDYALLGSSELLSAGSPTYEVAGVVRIPAGAMAVYSGELIMKTTSHEGGHLSNELGDKSVAVLPIDSARAALERKYGTLPQAPVLSPWCTGDSVPGFNDSRLATRAKTLLDRGCPGAN